MYHYSYSLFTVNITQNTVRRRTEQIRDITLNLTHLLTKVLLEQQLTLLIEHVYMHII